MGIFDRLRGDAVKVHILIRGRIGDQWLEIDEFVKVPKGTTLAELVAVADKAHIPLRDALDKSPHLAATMMLNGERTPIDANGSVVLADGDVLSLLAPLAGG